MMQLVLFDGPQCKSLLPLTFLRPVAQCRVGMLTITQKWEYHLNVDKISYAPQEYLGGLYPLNQSKEDKLYINGAVLPTKAFIHALESLDKGQCLYQNANPLAFKTNENLRSNQEVESYIKSLKHIGIESAEVIEYPEHILNYTEKEFLSDYSLMTARRSSLTLDNSVRQRGDQIFVGHDVQAVDAIINSKNGPVYIDDGAVIMENAVIQGPVYIGKNSRIHVGAKIYGGTMLGPHCRIGGEVKRSTIFGYSNKAHDGFLGDSVLGQWCNLGADTNNSNMKNTYGNVSLYSFESRDFRKTQRQFLGMFLGDHTLCAINTAFTTGSVTGIFCNIFNGAPGRFTDSFTWGSDGRYILEKAIAVATHAMGRRNVEMDPEYEKVIRHLYALES